MSFVGIVCSTLFWAIFATVLACMEIESEGKWGWAEKMPTWFRVTGPAAKLYGLFMSGKPLTGYHLFAFFLPVLIFHAHFAMGVPWTGAGELKAWAMYFAVCPLWDYYWFVLNPAYYRKFKRVDVWWHKKSHWIGKRFPIDYLVSLMASVGFAAGAAAFSGENSLLFSHLATLVGFGMYTVLLRLAAPSYHRWYYFMRKQDDRRLVEMLHTLDPPEYRDCQDRTKL